MPNWCYNDLTITGKPKMINKLLKQVETTPSEVSSNDDVTQFDFNKVIPMPEGAYWYEWNIANWGTKWNACDVQINGDWEEGEVNVYLETAWSPPEPVFRALAQQNPSLTFVLKTYEEGMSFYATIKYKGNSVEIIQEGEFNSETPCEIYQEYMGDGYHHYCQECNERFECDGDISNICPEYEAQVTETEKELWEKEQVNV